MRNKVIKIGVTLLLLALSQQASTQIMFFRPFTFPALEHGQYYTSWGVFEEDGGYVATGTHSMDLFLAKTDYNGDSLWFKLFPHGSPFQISWNHGSWDTGNDGYKIFTVWDSILLFDSEWNRTSIAPLQGVPHPRMVAVLSDGNYVFANIITINTYTLVKVNSETLEVIWTSDRMIQTFNYGLSSGFLFRSLVELPDGGICAVVRNFLYNEYGPEMLGSTLFRIDSEGQLVNTFVSNEKQYHHTFINNGFLTSLTIDNKVEYITTHTAEGQEIAEFALPKSREAYYIMKEDDKVIVLDKERSKVIINLQAYTTDGSLVWSSTHTPTSQYKDIIPGKLIATSDGGYLIYGDIYPAGTYRSIPFMLKTNESGQSAPLSIQEPVDHRPFHIYPNPATNYIRITRNEILGKSIPATNNLTTDILVFDTHGILRLSVPESQIPMNLNINSLPQGIYILKLTYGEKVEMFKFLKE